MYYTIAYTKDLASMQTLDFNKNGNEYTIVLSNENECCSRTFEKKEDAKDKFNLISTYFLDSWGDYEYRKKRLLDLEVK